MTFPERTRSECAVLACCGVMVPETSLRLPVQINWWNPPLISLGQFFRWSVRSNLRAKQPVCHIKPPSAECAFRCGLADFAKAATQIATSVDRSTVA